MARLARLELAPSEKERMRSELDAILAYIDKLRRGGHRPASSPPRTRCRLSTSCATTSSRPSFPSEAMLANAPDAAGGLFRVPRIIEE